MRQDVHMQALSSPRRPVGATSTPRLVLPRPAWLASDAWRFTIAFLVASLISTPFAISESDEQNESIKTLILYYTVWASGIFAVYPLLTHLAYRRFNRAQLRMLVARERRQGRVLRFLLTGGNAADWGGVVTLFSLGVVALVLIRKEPQTPLILGLSLALVVSGWFMMLIVYATEYLKRDLREGGLVFPGTEPPIYLDYLYFAQQIQTTYGGSDVSITETQMRRRVNSHNLLSFAYATFVVALLVSALLTVTGR